MKLSAMLVLLALGCTHQTRVDVAHAVVECARQDGTVLQAVTAEYEKLEKILDTGDADRWSKVLVTAVGDGLIVGGCAFAKIVSKKKVETSVAARSLIEQPDPTAVFEQYRSKYAGGATFVTSEGSP